MRGLKCIGPIQTITRGLLCLLALSFYSQHASAADYSWHMGGAHHSSTPSVTCDKYAAQNGIHTPRGSYISHSASFINVTTYRCYVSYYTFASGSDDVTTNYGDIYRVGTSCPSGQTYNSLTGLCEAPVPDKCEPTIGQAIQHSHRLGEFLATGGIGARVDPPGAVCKDDCQYAFSGSPAVNIYRFKNAEPTGVYGVYSYQGNGVSCESGTEPMNPPADGSPTNTKDSECTTKVVDSEGRQRFECSTSELTIEPGKLDCDVGESAGEMVCIPNSPSPGMNDKKVDTEVVETTNADGSKTTDTTTTTTTTKCSGVNSCNTTVTTSNHSSTTNGDGSQGPESSTCTGPGCKDSDGKTAEEKQEEEESKSSVTGDTACAAPPSCKGDAVECAILRQTHKSRCEDEEFRDLSAEKVASAKADLDSEFSGPDYQPLTAEEGSVFDIAGLVDTSSSISASCPALPPITFTIGGHTGSFSFAEWMAEICKYAVWFSYLMVAFAMRSGTEIIARGLN